MGGPLTAIARSLAAAVVFVGVALVSASPASAEEPMAGNYTYIQEGAPQYTWTILPTCVLAGCVLHVQGTLPGHGPYSSEPGYSGDAKLVNDRWTMGVNLTDGMKCPDGSTAPSSNVYTFDDATLTGTFTKMHGAVCGMQAGATKTPFSLVYKSPLPIPVELYPLQCPTFPNCAYNTEIPGELG
jgi:hypothetical protein